MVVNVLNQKIAFLKFSCSYNQLYLYLKSLMTTLHMHKTPRINIYHLIALSGITRGHDPLKGSSQWTTIVVLPLNSYHRCRPTLGGLACFAVLQWRCRSLFPAPRLSVTWCFASLTFLTPSVIHVYRRLVIRCACRHHLVLLSKEYTRPSLPHTALMPETHVRLSNNCSSCVRNFGHSQSGLACGRCAHGFVSSSTIQRRWYLRSLLANCPSTQDWLDIPADVGKT